MMDDPRLTDLYKRLPSGSPSAAADERILAAARAAVRKRSSRIVPWAAAATLVMGVGLAWQVVQFDRQAVEIIPDSRLPASSVARPEARHSGAEVLDEMAAGPVREGIRRSRQDLLGEGQGERTTTAPSVMSRPLESRSEMKRAAPAVMADSDPCADQELPGDTLSRAQWRELLEAAERSADPLRLECLQRAFRQRFEPTTKPATDK
jgi:hypothetical protein